MPDSTIYAKRLRQARLAADLSQKALGIAAGIDEFSASPRMNQYERGKHLPDLLTMEHLAQTLGLPLAFFFAEDDALADLLMAWPKLSTTKQRELVTKATSSKAR
ncbi:MAG: XRE family transcriptional regulator [Rhodocyclaceae bacterium]|nr:MAG: XRE family transcriptional regulator [Rhodocyclaceae bacterium]